MRSLILYNWEVRDAYFQAFEALPVEELTKDRQAGLGSIVKTLFHIIDVEYSWVCVIAGKPDMEFDSAAYGDIQSLAALSNQLRAEIRNDLLALQMENLEYEYITAPWMTQTFSKAEILKHLIVHEVHHVGQLSIWARELGIEPVSANFIGKDLFNKTKAAFSTEDEPTNM
ncbi:DinB family protein [Paenibacillus cellulosilyticus]|nr:DinB family protein [Paenibacillus cellulosilyticus]QKS45017.1 DinB family protein [Paenibacillus cellulosilyticus]